MSRRKEGEQSHLMEPEKKEKGAARIFDSGTSVVDDRTHTLKHEIGNVAEAVNKAAEKVTKLAFGAMTLGLIVEDITSHKKMPESGKIEIVSGNALGEGEKKVDITNAIEMMIDRRKKPVSETYLGNKVESAEVEDSVLSSGKLTLPTRDDELFSRAAARPLLRLNLIQLLLWKILNPKLASN